MTEETETNPLATMIDYIAKSEFEKANDIFNDVLGQRVSDTIDQEKIGMAQSMYSSEEDDLDISDEEIETALDELEDDLEEV